MYDSYNGETSSPSKGRLYYFFVDRWAYCTCEAFKGYWWLAPFRYCCRCCCHGRRFCSTARIAASHVVPMPERWHSSGPR